MWVGGANRGEHCEDFGEAAHEKEIPIMKKGERLVIIGMGGVGGPAAMLAKRLMPEVDVTVIREEERFIVR